MRKFLEEILPVMFNTTEGTINLCSDHSYESFPASHINAVTRYVEANCGANIRFRPYTNNKTSTLWVKMSYQNEDRAYKQLMEYTVLKPTFIMIMEDFKMMIPVWLSDEPFVFPDYFLYGQEPERFIDGFQEGFKYHISPQGEGKHASIENPDGNHFLPMPLTIFNYYKRGRKKQVYVWVDENRLGPSYTKKQIEKHLLWFMTEPTHGGIYYKFNQECKKAYI